MQGSGLAWFGCGSKRLSFAFADDLELYLPQGGRPHTETAEGDTLPDDFIRLFPRRIGRYNLQDIVRFSKSDSRTVTKKLWDLVWQGLVTNDTFTALRQGILTDFAPRRSEERAPPAFSYRVQPVERRSTFSGQLACS